MKDLSWWLNFAGLILNFLGMITMAVNSPKVFSIAVVSNDNNIIKKQRKMHKYFDVGLWVSVVGFFLQLISFSFFDS